jgi:type III pantothenate kinase
VDVGNSQTKLGWFEDGQLHGPIGLPSGGAPPAVGCADAAIADLVARLPQPPSGAVMCCVVPQAIEHWRQALRGAVGADALVVSGDSDIGIRNGYRDPAALGPDRLVGALAAREIYGAPVIVVSLGTATVIGVVSPAGEFIGGAIAPGVDASLAALAQQAARLAPVTFARAPKAIATDTRGGMIAGAYFGTVGQVKELLARARAEIGQDVPAVLTGGYAELVAPELSNVAGIEPALNLIGLRLAWEYVHSQWNQQ